MMFLMIVTPPDSHIAEFTVKRFVRLLNDRIQLCIYFNGLAPDEQRRIRKRVGRNPYVRIKDNYAEIARNREVISSQVGKTFVTASGRASELREGFYDSQAEIWSRELVGFGEYDLVGIIDPDFEVFEPDFLAGIPDAFAANERLGFLSTDYSPATEVYDSYSREQCILEERYHTWFCVYRRRALEYKSDFYFDEERGEKVRKWDHSAKLQRILSDEYGYVGTVLPAENRWKYLHYSSFAQNRNLRGSRLRLYRALRIGRHNGFIHLHKSSGLAPTVQRLCNWAYGALGMQKYDREREHYIFESA